MLTLLSATDTTKCTNDRVVECESTLAACDEAVTRCGQLLSSQAKLIADQRIALENAEKRARELQEQRDSIWRNPLLWGVTGALIGVGAGVWLSR